MWVFSDLIHLMISTFIFPLGSMFEPVYLRCIGYYHVVFGLEFLALLYLMSRFLDEEPVDVFACIFVG